MGDGAGEIHHPAARNGERVESPRNKANYRIAPTDAIGKGSLKQKCRANIEAIRLLRTLETEKRAATAGEKSTLVKYVGWSGIPQVFDRFWSRATVIPACCSSCRLVSARACSVFSGGSSGGDGN